METWIGAVLTASQTARSLRVTIENNLGNEVEIGVTSGETLAIVFREISDTTATGTTTEGNEAIVSLGGEAELDTKHPTIVVGAAKSASN